MLFFSVAFNYSRFKHRKPGKASRDNPCTNWVEKCKVCQDHVWKYNLPVHFAAKHKDHSIYEIDPEEITLVTT